MIREFTSLQEANRVRNESWDKNNKLDIGFFGVEMAGECGEACNVIKKLLRERLGLPGSKDTVQHLGEELSDVVICAYLCADKEGIDLEEAIISKFNSTSEKLGFDVRLVRK